MLLQVVPSLLLGGIVFYIIAPYNSGLGIIVYEYKVVLLAVAICILISSTVKLFYKKVSLLILSIFSSIAIISMVFIYPASHRLEEPNQILREEIESHLELYQRESIKLHSIAPRPKVMFDIFRKKSWFVTVNCAGTKKKLYIKVTMLGGIENDIGNVCMEFSN